MLIKRLAVFAFSLLAIGSAQAEDYSLIQFLSVQSATAPHFAPSGRDLIYTTNITGVPQIWGMAVLGSYQKQITFDTNGVAGASWSPVDDKKMIVSAAVGGNERTQLFEINPYGGPVKRITTDQSAIYRMGPWSANGERFAYATNSRNKKDFDIYEYELQTEQSTLIYQGDGLNAAADYSPDSRYLLIVRTHSSANSDIILFDANTRQSKVLTTHDGDVVYRSPHWDGTDKGFYLISDQGKEFLGIAYWPIDSTSLRWVETPQWDIEALAVSRDGSMIAWSVNAGGYSQFGFRDFRRGWDVAPNRLPNGIVSGMEFSSDGTRLALTLGSASRPVDVWIYETDQDKMHQVTFSSTGGIPTSEFREPELVEYPTFDGRKIPAYFFPPAVSSSKAPVVVAIHGGPEEQSRPVLSGLYQYLTHRGYAVLLPNVRGSTGYGKSYQALDNVRKRMDSVQDLEYAARWLDNRNDVDSKRIALYGGSYGGFMVLSALATYPDRWAAGVSMVGIANFVTFLENTGIYRRASREAEYGTLEADREFLTEISPVTHAARIKAPLMLIQGANDPRVPQEESDQMAKAIRDQGGTVEYLLFDDEGHGLAKLRNRINAYSTVADFLDKYVSAPN